MDKKKGPSKSHVTIQEAVLSTKTKSIMATGDAYNMATFNSVTEEGQAVMNSLFTITTKEKAPFSDRRYQKPTNPKDENAPRRPLTAYMNNMKTVLKTQRGPLNVQSESDMHTNMMQTFSHTMLSTDHLPKNVFKRKAVEKEARHTISDIHLFEQKQGPKKKNRYPVIALKAHL